MTRADRGIQDAREWGEVLPEAWYHVRIKSAKDNENGEQIVSKSSGNPICQLQLICQEEPFVGQMIFDEPSLQPHALAKLKRYYTCTGQGMFEDGTDDPEALKDGECYVKVEHETYEGTVRMKISPNGIRPLSEGKPA